MPSLSRYKRRQRKKLRLGEFQELGFGVSGRFRDGLDQAARMAFLQAFLDQAIEQNGLMFGGGLEPSLEGYVVLDHPGSVSEAQREAVLAWLKGQEVLAEVEADALSDAWYPEL